LSTGFIRLLDADVPVKVVKIPTAPTATTQRQKKTCKAAEFYAGDMRSVLAVAVGNNLLAVDNQQQYRPQESPANGPFSNDAGDAGDTLRGSSSKTNAVALSAGQPH
jgi:hypothetical protein